MNPKVIQILKKYCDTGRKVTGKVGKQVPVGDEWYMLDCISMKAPDPVEKATDKIQEAISANAVAHLMFETIEDKKDVAYQAYPLDKFIEIVAFIQQKREEGRIEVMNMSTFYESRFTCTSVA